MKDRRRSLSGIVYRTDGRVVLRTFGVQLGRAELLLGRVERRADGWHFATTRIASSCQCGSANCDGPTFEFEVDQEPYKRRGLARAALVAVLSLGGAP